MEDLKNSEVVQIERLEQKTVWLALKGLKGSEIAKQLGLRPKSVEKLLENVRRKISAATSSAERENA